MRGIDAIRKQTGAEVVTLETVKNSLGIATSMTDHDAMLQDYIKAARQLIEERCNISLVDHEITATLDDGTQFYRLPYGPVKSITSVKTYDTTGTLADTLVAGTDYYLQGGDQTKLVFINETSYFVKVIYTAGFTTAIPDQARPAIEALVRWWYDNPDKVMLLPDKLREVQHAIRTMSRKDWL